MNPGRSYKRRKFFVKQWLQLRYMLTLAGSAVAGGVIFGFIIQHRLERMIRLEMYKSHSKVQSLWEVLYPDVMKITLALFVVSVVILLMIFKLFSHRVNKSVAGLNAHISSIMSATDPDEVVSGIAIREFKEYGKEVGALVAFYRKRWSGITVDVREAEDICEKMRSAEGDERRIEILGSLEKNLESLVRGIRRSAGGKTS